ncbi:hypothetical protein ACIHCQ_22335 [Streptomyces sp. NPDC052236]|uniref:hypothetical protein n=1 Tax=Streptomyces sp. NPDC052236 TaxID=3365686 RepID=UPI0037CFDE74
MPISSPTTRSVSSILDRKHSRVHVLTEPVANGYDNNRIHAAGEEITLPESIGAEVKLDVAALLKAGARKAGAPKA